MSLRIRLSDRVVDLLRQEVVTDDGDVMRLGTMEVELLGYLAARPGAVVSRDDLLTDVWEHAPTSLSRAVDKAMNRLRFKVERDSANPEHLITVRGEGYRFVPPDEATAASGGSSGAFTMVANDAPTPLEAVAPRPLDPFVGRAAELAELSVALQDDATILTLLGPGGIGKTRLALELARATAQQGDWPGGAFFVDLSPVSDAGQVPAAIAQVLDVPLRMGSDPATALADVLAGRRRTLLVLDNLEQILDGAGELLMGLLPAARSTTVLATSRVALGIVGERAVEVGPLTTSAAAELFERRVLRGATADHAAIEALVTRLEGIPLAIELAAARGAVLSPADMLRRLDRGQDALGSGPRGGPARHRTMHAAIRWSWDALSAPDKAALAVMASMPGGFELDTIEGLLPEDDAIERLAGLRDCSLVRTQASARGWRFGLFDTIRAFVIQEQPVDDAFRARRGAWFAALSERLVAELAGPTAVSALSRLLDERHNLALAADDALGRGDVAGAIVSTLGVDPVNTRRGLATPSTLGLLDRCLHSAAEVEPGLRVDLLTQLGAARWFGGDRERGLALLERAWTEATELGAPSPIASAATAWASVLATRSRSSEAEDVLQAARSRVAGNAAAEAVILGQLGIVVSRSGRPADAVPLLTRAIHLYEATGAVLLVPRGMVNLAVALKRSDRVEEAAAWYERALAMRPKRGDRYGVAINKANLGLLLSEVGRLEEARALVQEAVASLRTLGRPSMVGAQLGNLGGILARLEADDDAERAFWESSAIVDKVGSRSDKAYLCAQWSQFRFSRGRLAEAADFAQRACDAASGLDPILEGHVRGHHAACLACTDQLEAARAELVRAQAHFDGVDYPLGGEVIAFFEGFLAAASGDLPAASAALERAESVPVGGRRAPLAAQWHEITQLVPALQRLMERASAPK